jgi:hypothetical protein
MQIGRKCDASRWMLLEEKLSSTRNISVSAQALKEALRLSS